MLVWMGFNMWSRPADILWDTATKHIDFINNHLTHTEKSVWQGLFMGREQKSQDFAPNCPFCALFPTSCLPSTNSFLCFYATSFYQTPSLSHLFQLSWDACLSPRFFCCVSFLLSSSPLLFCFSCFLPQESSVTYCAPCGTTRNKQPRDSIVIWKVLKWV